MTSLVSRVTLLLLLATGQNRALAQENSPARRALREVAATADVARWLTRYDRIAWVSSDSVLAAPSQMQAELGPEWFCDTLRGAWHAFYGRYDASADTYRIVFHFAVDTTGRLRSSTVAVDSTRVLAMARALHVTQRRLPPTIAPPGLSLNAYVRWMNPALLEVRFLPAFQRNGTLVIGGEATYALNATGRVVLDSTYHFTGYRAVRPDTSVAITIPAEDREYPTVGQLFFVLNFHQSFRALNIRTRRIFGSLFTGGEGPDFVFAVRDTMP